MVEVSHIATSFFALKTIHEDSMGVTDASAMDTLTAVTLEVSGCLATCLWTLQRFSGGFGIGTGGYGGGFNDGYADGGGIGGQKWTLSYAWLISFQVVLALGMRTSAMAVSTAGMLAATSVSSRGVSVLQFWADNVLKAGLMTAAATLVTPVHFVLWVINSQ
jgi:hypothetical protein